MRHVKQPLASMTEVKYGMFIILITYAVCRGRLGHIDNTFSWVYETHEATIANHDISEGRHVHHVDNICRVQGQIGTGSIWLPAGIGRKERICMA